MGCVQSYFKRAQTGISPSSTQESNSKQAPSEDDTKPILEERSITEEPESNDTSYGVEATAVRTLAATTGTVAILGTTAKTGDKKDATDKEGSDSASPVVVETIPEEQEEPTVNVEKAVVHEEEKKEEDTKESESSSKPNSANSQPISNQSEESVGNKEDSVVEEKVLSPPSASSETKEENPPSESPAASNKSPLTGPDKSEINSPEVKSPISPPHETEPKNAEENASELVVSELTKEEDVSKSISSERLKTNSISNTTLSSDSIAEFENNSVKQSPSADKVIESFDSSSTVEFVDSTARDSTKVGEQQDDTRTNPGRSISSDLSNKGSLPLDGEKTPDALSPEEPEGKLVNDDPPLPPPPPPLEEEEVLEANPLDDTLETEAKSDKETKQLEKQPSEPKQEESNTISSSKDQVINDETSINSEVSSNLSSSVQSVVKNDTNAQEVNSKSAVDNSSPNASEENNKAETGSPFSSDNNSPLNGNGEGASPEKVSVVSPPPTSVETAEENHKVDTELNKSESRETTPENSKEEPKLEKKESAAPDEVGTSPQLTNGLQSRTETPNDSVERPDSGKIPSKTNSIETTNSIEATVNKTPEPKVNGEVSEDVFGSPIDLTDEKVVAAATTIQATFRGFQTRQTLKGTGNEEEGLDNSKCENVESEIKKSVGIVEETPLNSVSEGFDSTTEQPDSILEDVDDKMIAAATTIQANFRGFQTRQMIKSKMEPGIAVSEETNQSIERKTPTALTPELIESVKEEVNDICKEAETIAAERAESADGMIKGVDQVVVEAKSVGLPSVSDSVLAVRGSASPPSVTEEALDEDTKEEVFDSLTDLDEKTINAATTIQATFRGFQTRKQLQQTQDQPDSMPNFPPPAAEDEYLQSLEELPPPDFEALESSYSEDVPTEPLAPPPPLDQESLVFNEEDEDELMALQRPQECDELPEHRLTVETDSSESSLSSAATKIQAGMRGYLTRKQLQAQSGGTGTTSTSTNVLDSDQSLSVSREDDGVRSAISTEEESEVCRHMASPETDVVATRPVRSAGKRMSLGSSIADLPPARIRAPLRSALSVQGPGPVVVDDDEVWSTLKNEMSDAATRIQSNFRGYRARKQLQREDAMQVTSSSSQATPSSGSVDIAGRASAASGEAEKEDKTARSSGEYHDIIALTPPNLQPEEGGGAAAQPVAVADQPADSDMVKRRAEDDAKEAAAATKIQATYRGFKSRKEMKDVDQAAAKIQAGFRGYKVRKEMKKNEIVRSSSNPDQDDKSSTPQSGSLEETAATKIQAGVRGFLVRRRYQKEQDAATKIQSGFRGFRSRKQAADQ